MTTRKINTCISTIRSVYDENGKYLPSGNYYFIIDDMTNNYVRGKVISREINSYFIFSYMKFIRMMANAQSRLISFTDLVSEEAMPNYRFPITAHNTYFTGFSTASEIPRIHSTLSNVIRSRYVVNYYDPLSYMRTNNIVINRPYRYIERQNTQINEEENEKCSICWEPIGNLSRKTLICNHSFHSNCVNRWLESNSSCPLCRREVTTTRTRVRRSRLTRRLNRIGETSFYNDIV